MAGRLKFVAALPALCGAMALAQGAGLPAILSDPVTKAAQPLPDFSYAGYGFGIMPIPDSPGTVIKVIDHGAVADDGKDDTKAVLKALAAADATQGKVTVRFPKGRIQITEVLPIERGDLVLDGAGQGEGGTELYFPRPLKIADKSDLQDELRAYLRREDKYQREPDQNLDDLFSEYSWSGAFIWVGPKKVRAVSYDGSKDKRDAVLSKALAGKQFGRELTVESAAALKVGQVVQLQWFAAEGENSAILRSLYGDPSKLGAQKIGSHHWTSPNRATVAQSTRIAAIKGNTVTLGDPLLHDVSAAQPAQLANWEHLTNVGIQDMKLAFPYAPWFGHHLEQGYNGIYMTGVFDGWIRDVTVHNADSAILTDNAASLTISKIATTGNHKAHYSVHIGAVHNVLVSDLTVDNPVIHPLSVNTRSTRSVYLRATVTRDAALDQHSGANHQNLFDQLTLTIKPKKDSTGQWRYRLWDGGGAAYWKPGHGLYNTHWNIRLIVPEDGPAAGEQVQIYSGLEGAGARIVGLHGNRVIELLYKPDAYIEGLNRPVSMVPSLYDYQLAKRRGR